MVVGSSCYLRSLSGSLSSPPKEIRLPHKIPVKVGRNPETGIIDLHVSRDHLELVADYPSQTVVVRTSGKSCAGCNGYAMLRNRNYTLQNGDMLEVRLGFHQYKVVFT